MNVFNSLLLSATLLSSFTANPTPWLQIEANSEQRQPVYLGSTPREIELGFEPQSELVLPEQLRAQAEKALARLAEEENLRGFEVEAWPIHNENGALTWAFSRWRKLGRKAGPNPEDAPWFWLDDADFEKRRWRIFRYIQIPSTLKPWLPEEDEKIFADLLLQKDLYDKPHFGRCVWTDELGTRIYAAWMPLTDMATGETVDLKTYRKMVMREQTPGRRRVCRQLNQTARWNGAPLSFVIRHQEGETFWPEKIIWKRVKKPELTPSETESLIASWPRNFVKEYRKDVLALDGEGEAVFPISGRKMRFTRKNSANNHDAQAGEIPHQLLEMVSYLEERYQVLGLQTFRQTFNWRGIPQANLVAVIPGTDPQHDQFPVLMADHFDTAFSQEHYSETGSRLAVPGADDNITATAGLLRAAEIFQNEIAQGRKPKYDIWLVHLTGEEFPADDLGARRLIGRLLKNKQDIRGLVLMDMIGYHAPGSNGLFQVNAGESEESIEIAQHAMNAAAAVAPELTPVFRARFDQKSYLYNTDGVIFSDTGYPVILLNEHINRLENFERPHYHEHTDRAETLDWEYATGIVKVAIETTARLAF